MSILPKGQVKDEPGYMGPNYDFADNLPLPGQVGVHRGGELDDVINAIKGVAYYGDMIGFGAPSSSFTQNMGNKPRPLGINYFIKTGLKCSNGANMWYYVNGIPTGEGLGKNVKKALESSGMPPLKGLAPGMLEDTEDALNPLPVMNALLGSGFPQCRKVTLPVGDPTGKVVSNDGEVWIPGKIETLNGMPAQTKWVQDVDRKGNPISITKEDYDKEPKDYCPDGTLVSEHNGNCSLPLKNEGFVNYRSDPEAWLLAFLLSTAAIMSVGRCVLWR